MLVYNGSVVTCLTDNSVVQIIVSEALALTNRVPQGSILGPLLFNIYVNDLPTISQKCHPHCYVDDTGLLLSFKLLSNSLAVDNINNCLLLNPEKTKLLVFGSRQMLFKLQDFSLTLLGKELKSIEMVKDLGVTLDVNLTYNHHINKTVSTCMSILGQMTRVKHAFDRCILITIINSLVFSRLYYCSVWSNTSKCNIEKLQLIQNFACRIVCGISKFDHVTPALKELKWLPVTSELYLRNATLAFKCMTGCAPDYLAERFVKRGIPRSSQKFPEVEHSTI